MYKPWSHRVTLSHDSYSCRRFSASDMEARPFPSRREEEVSEEECNYVGSPCAARQGGGVRSNIDTGDPKFVSLQTFGFSNFFKKHQKSSFCMLQKCPEECRKDPGWEYC